MLFYVNTVAIDHYSRLFTRSSVSPIGSVDKDSLRLRSEELINVDNERVLFVPKIKRENYLRLNDSFWRIGVTLMRKLLEFPSQGIETFLEVFRMQCNAIPVTQCRSFPVSNDIFWYSTSSRVLLSFVCSVRFVVATQWKFPLTRTSRIIARDIESGVHHETRSWHSSRSTLNYFGPTVNFRFHLVDPTSS